MVGFAHLYRPRTLARTWGTRTGFVPNESWLKKLPHPFSNEPTIPPTTPPSVRSLAAEGMYCIS
jgi:hypothetical protein